MVIVISMGTSLNKRRETQIDRHAQLWQAFTSARSYIPSTWGSRIITANEGCTIKNKTYSFEETGFAIPMHYRASPDVGAIHHDNYVKVARCYTEQPALTTTYGPDSHITMTSKFDFSRMPKNSRTSG